MDAEGAQLRVLRRDRVGCGRLVEKVSRDGAGEREHRHARVGGHRREHLEEPGAVRASALRRRDHDDGRSGLNEEPGDREAKRSRVGSRQLARAANLPGVERGVSDGSPVGDDGEHARIASWWAVFEGHTSEDR